MSELLRCPPYGPRNDSGLLEELNALARHHLDHCAAYAQIWKEWSASDRLAGIPYLHVGLFKLGEFRTDFPGVRHGRTLHSSGTSGSASRITLDEESSSLQSQSAAAILKDFLGEAPRPLLVLDSAESLRTRGAVTARLAAAMSLRTLASEIHFLLEDSGGEVRWGRVGAALEKNPDLIVYGLTSALWTNWAEAKPPEAVRAKLSEATISFVHSGGWKNLEAEGVDSQRLERTLLEGVGAGSRVLDFYGLAEQVGLLYPLCAEGFRHVPVWADILVRDAWSLETLEGEPGMLQLLNVLARGAPYFSVLTEDLGRIVPGACPCGRSGKRFQLLGRVPKAELRGCGNV